MMNCRLLRNVVVQSLAATAKDNSIYNCMTSILRSSSSHSGKTQSSSNSLTTYKKESKVASRDRSFEHHTPSPYKTPGPRRYGYVPQFKTDGVLPRDGRPVRSMPRYRPKDNWATKKALFGQNDYIGDDVYDALRSKFLMTGKGRRPACPPVSSTNKLILQLDLLRQEGGSSFDDMTSWYRSLCSVDVTMGRLQHKIQTVLKSTFISEPQFLSEIVDFDAVSPVLAELSLSRSVLLADAKDFSPNPSTLVTNNVVMTLDIFRSMEGLPMTFVIRWILRLSNSECKEATIKRKALKTLQMVKKLKNSKKVQELNSYLSEKFFEENENVEDAPQEKLLKLYPQVMNTKTTCDHAKEAKELRRKVERLTNNQDQLLLQLEVQILKEEREQLRNEMSIAKDRLNILEKEAKENRELKKEIGILNEEIKKYKVSRTYHLNSVLRKETEKAAETNDKLLLENESLKVKMEELMSSHQEEIGATKEDISCLKKKLKNVQTDKSKLRKKLDLERNVTEALLYTVNMPTEDRMEPQFRGSKYNQFTNDVRLAYMALQGEGNVSADNASKVVQIICKYIWGYDIGLERLPSASTAINFADEAHHIAKQHVVESIMQSEHFTYGLDGTSRQRRNFLERHIILGSKKVLSLGYAEIASDDASTLLEQSVALFQELTKIHLQAAEEKGTSSETSDEIMWEIISKLKCIMSDRASVMKLFDQKMAQYKKDFLGEEKDVDASTHFLFCNAHFLLGLSTAAKEGVTTEEKELIKEGGPMGRDASAAYSSFSGSNSKENAVVRLIRTATSVLGPRGDEKSGCRQHWLAFCHKDNISSRFTSFRDNRFNNLFENAEAVIFHRNHIVDFLTNWIPKSNMLLESVLLDLQDKRVMSSVGALAIAHVLFTGPYWRLMNSYLPYGSFPQYVKSMSSTIDHWLSEGFTVSADTDPVFDDFTIKKDTVIDFLASDDYSTDVLQTIFHRICLKFKDVLIRQLNDFLPKGVYGGEIHPDVQKLLDTCPLTNLTGERLFGDLDFDMSKRRYASTHHRSSINMFKHNDTVKWISKKTDKERDAIMKAGRMHGKHLREEHNAAVDAVREKQKARLEETERKKKEKENQEQEIKAKLLTKVLSDGGLITTKHELDHMYRTGKAEDLKAQLKYRKLFMKEKDIKVTGTRKMMYTRLLEKISAADESDEDLQKSEKDMDLESTGKDTDSESACQDTASDSEELDILSTKSFSDTDTDLSDQDECWAQSSSPQMNRV